MQFETVVLVMILALAVTIAWFVMSKLANVAGINAKVAVVTDDIKVSMSEDEAELGPDESIKITGESSDLMPGKSGGFDFYVTSLKPEVTGVTIDSLEFACAFRDGVQADGKTDVLNYLSKHIVFHMQVGESEESHLYNPENNEFWEITLPEGVPVHIRITYKWAGKLGENDLLKDTDKTEREYNMEDTIIGERIRSMALSFKISSIRTTSDGN